jgi:cytochrome b6-f complex iron-sulfur subunit
MSAMPSNAEPSKSPIGRRSFIKLATQSLLAVSGLLGLGGLLRFLSFQPDPASPSTFDLGAASDYPPGSRTVIPQASAVLLHTESGYLALSLICPHLGCTLKPDQSEYACPCHASRFNAAGSRLSGPANQPMKALRVEETADGQLVLHVKFE